MRCWASATSGGVSDRRRSIPRSFNSPERKAPRYRLATESAGSTREGRKLTHL